MAKRRENGAMITLQRPHRGTYREAVAGSDLFGGVSNKSKANADIGTCAGQLWVGVGDKSFFLVTINFR